MIHYTAKDVERFWSKVDKSGGEDACWLWTASLHKVGRYGQFWLDNQMRRSSRITWIFSYGDIPDGMLICHHCDNPPCCNPNHLFLGTHQDNSDDKMRKRRDKPSKGEKNGNSKLNWEIVREIRYRYATENIGQRKLAMEYGISQPEVGYITRGEIWKE